MNNVITGSIKSCFVFFFYHPLRRVALALVTSSSPLAQLFVLNKACEHLSIHKELQELADSAGGVRFAEIVSLELPASVGRLDHVQRIVAHQLHEEPHKTLRHQRAQVSPLTWTGPR